MPASSFSCPAYEGPAYEWVHKIRSENINSSVTCHFRRPLLIHCGHMQWLFDDRGNRYLDLFGGICTVSVGHCHPKVAEALERQVRTLWHTSNIYMHPKIHEYAYQLTQKLPKHLNVVYFVNSGSEANDLAMTLARQYTTSLDIISIRNCYHGASPPTIALCGHSTWKPKNSISSNIIHVTNPDPYQGQWGGYRDSPIQSLRASESEVNKDGVCSSADKYLESLREVLHYSVNDGRPAAFFAESIQNPLSKNLPFQGVGGTVQFPLGYLKKAFALVKEHGGVCISDEVQTGFGRTGTHFWGFEGHGLTPDIVTMAKGMGNGFPLAAVVTTPEIAKSLGKTLHFNTFGGNPLSCSVGLSVLEALEEDKSQEIP
ncbi:Alanine--glyoxylate aminotransferase 2, mitochondrial [Armadillidium vulgare]|nr:Alanine--glyoxylate aminotransferase 2, mitochondrial [Armadillidium vulgare]